MDGLFNITFKIKKRAIFFFFLKRKRKSDQNFLSFIVLANPFAFPEVQKRQKLNNYWQNNFSSSLSCTQQQTQLLFITSINAGVKIIIKIKL